MDGLKARISTEWKVGNKILSYLDRLSRKIDCAMILETGVGIKPINQLVKSDHFKHIVIDTKTDLRIEQLFASPDFLKDKYTLIGKNIDEMPHYDLIRHLDRGLPLSTCSYVKRCQNGTLDFRRKRQIKPELLRNAYQEKLNAMENGEIFVVKVYLAYDDGYLIADGKHSLAVASYFNYTNLRFDVIQNMLFDSYFRWLFDRISNNKEFKKHSILYRKAYGYREREIDRIIESGSDKQPNGINRSDISAYLL